MKFRIRALMKCMAAVLAIAPLTIVVSSWSTSAASYQLMPSVYAEVASASAERLPDGWLIAAVVRLQNQGAKTVRVPDYTVQAATSDNVQYALRPSLDNVQAIQPKETVELRYMTSVRRSASFSLTRLIWIQSDPYVYPKKEKQVLSIPVTPRKIVKLEWGEPFTIPDEPAALRFTPIQSFRQNTPQGSDLVVVVQAENTGKLTETIPDFQIDGKTNAKTYPGRRVDAATVTLEPGGKTRLYYAISLSGDDQPGSLSVSTSETFTDARGPVTYRVAHAEIALTSPAAGSLGYYQLSAYKMGSPIRLDPFNQIIHPDLELSLADLRIYQTEGDAFRTAVAKFKIVNRGDRPVPVAPFEAQLMSPKGTRYQGVMQGGPPGSIAPGMGYAVRYSFPLPNTENGDQFGIILLDSASLPPYAIPIATLRVGLGSADPSSPYSLYPFHIGVKEWQISHSQAKLNLEVKRESNLAVDPGFSSIKVLMTNEEGEVIGSRTVPLVGGELPNGGWIVLGSQPGDGQKPADTEGLDAVPDRLSVYEALQTPYGEATRLLTTLE